MLRLLPVLLVLGFAVIALIDCLARDADEIRGIPKIAWVFVILLFPLLGSIVWFLAGRPRGQARRAGPDGTPARTGLLAPDDDPDFLAGLNTQRQREDDELLQRWEEDLRRREDELRRQQKQDPSVDD